MHRTAKDIDSAKKMKTAVCVTLSLTRLYMLTRTKDKQLTT